MLNKIFLNSRSSGIKRFGVKKPFGFKKINKVLF